MMEFGNRLYELRKQKGLSQEELANKLHVTRQTISKWEVGDSTPDMGKLIALSEVFEISLDELVKGVEQDKTKKLLTEENKKKVKKGLKVVGIFAAIILLVDVISMIVYFAVYGPPESTEDFSNEHTETVTDTEKTTETEARYAHLTVEERTSRKVVEDENYWYICSRSIIYKVDKASKNAQVLWQQEDYEITSGAFNYGGAILLEDELYFFEMQYGEEETAQQYYISSIHTDGSEYQVRAELEHSHGPLTLFLQNDILYITDYYGEECYQLLEDGSLTKVEEGNLVAIPQEYDCASYDKSGSQYLSGAESLERFGCIFAVNEKGNLVKREEDGNWQVIKNTEIEFISGEMVLFVKTIGETQERWLWNSNTLEETYIGAVTQGTSIVGIDEEYIYLAHNEKGEAGYTAYVIEKQKIGSEEAKEIFSLSENRYWTYPGLFEFSKDTGDFYYDSMNNYSTHIMRRNLSDIEKEEVLVPTFYDSGISDIGALERYYEKVYSKEYPEYVLMTIETERLVVDEKYEGAETINQFLMQKEQDLIASKAAMVEEAEEWIAENGMQDAAYYYIGSSVSPITYKDENYFSFYQETYIYYGGAHGMPFWTGYTFDLKTGQRLTLRDMVDNSEDEVKEIITKYVSEYINQNPEYFFSDAIESVEKMAGYESQFYLTEEGIVIYYEPYAITAYAAGFQEVTIPYEAFKMKILR